MCQYTKKKRGKSLIDTSSDSDSSSDYNEEYTQHVVLTVLKNDATGSVTKMKLQTVSSENDSSSDKEGEVTIEEYEYNFNKFFILKRP